MKRILLLSALLGAACERAPQIETVAAPPVSASNAADPALGVDPGNGDLLLSWVEGDSAGYRLLFARSSDAGASWSTPQAITAQTGEVKPHAEASPRLVAAGGVLGLFWPKQQHIAGRRFPASNMRFSRSTDGGRTWSVPVTLNDDTASAPSGHTFHGATALDDSTLMVAWLDSREVVEESHGGDVVHHAESSAVYTATSRDGGATWEAANQRFWSGACPCCRVSLAGLNGDIIAAWRGHFANDVRDVVTASLTKPNQQPQRVHTDNWSFPGCPHSGPGISVRAGDVHITWFTGAPGRAGVYYKVVGSEAAPLTILTGENLPAAHPAVVALKDGAVIAINVDVTGERMLTVATVVDGEVQSVVVPNSRGADHPQLVRLTDDRALIAWTQQADGRSSVRMARVRLN